MSPVLGILAIALLVVFIVCGVKESSVTGMYKTCKVYGRLKAYFALDFLIAGIMLVGVNILSWLSGTNLAKEMNASGPLFFILGVVLLAVAVFIYFSTYQKCPDPLKKACIPSMLLTGVGICIKICVFFLAFVWKITAPEMVMTQDGSSVVVFKNGEVYDPVTGRMGVLQDGGTTAVFPGN